MEIVFGKVFRSDYSYSLVALLLSVAVAVYHIATGEAGMSALFEPAGIALAILLATVVGFLFEMSAAKKFDILNQVNDDLPVKVIRGGHMLEIPKREIVRRHRYVECRR